MSAIIVLLLPFAALGLMVVLAAVRESWKFGRLRRRRNDFREWLAWRPPSRPLRRLRFRLGVRLMRPRLDAMYLRYKRAYDADQTNDFALHHVFAVDRLRSWREALEEDENGRSEP